MYEPTVWVDDGVPDINEDNLNKIEQGIKKAHETADKNAENIAAMAGNQMPEEYLKAAVDAYVEKNSAGFATQAGMAELESQLAGQIDEVNGQLTSEIDNVNGEVNSILTERTEQLFDYKTATPITKFIDTSTQSLNPNNNCYSVIIPVDCTDTYTLYVKKITSSRFSVATFNVENPTTEKYVRTVESNGTELQIGVNADIKSIVIWYHYNASEDTDSILKSIVVSKKHLEFSTPYKGVCGYSVHSDSLSKVEETDSPFLWGMYSNTAKANHVIYANDYKYHKGYVKNIRVKVNGDTESTIEVYIIKAFDNIVLRKYTVKGVGELLVDVNEYIGLDFYVGAGGTNASYITYTYGVYPLNYCTFENSKYKEGDILPLEFSDKAISDGIYTIAHEVIYDSLRNMAYEERKVFTHNRMFAAGDSITAGDPSYREGEHWWECVARTLGYKCDVGARNGSGYSFWNYNNGCKIARTTDFKKYNLAVFAFGTNDYGQNIPIGTFNDEYTVTEDSSNTFYACVKYVIKTVKESNPSCQLILSLPINRMKGSMATKWAYGEQNNAGHTLNDYCEAIIECCNHYGIAYIDNRNGAFDVFSLGKLLHDGLHPTVDGYKVLGQQMSAKIGALVRPYTEYNGVGGIGQW